MPSSAATPNGTQRLTMKRLDQQHKELAAEFKNFVSMVKIGTNLKFALTVTGLKEETVRSVLGIAEDIELTHDTVLEYLVLNASMVNTKLDVIIADQNKLAADVDKTKRKTNVVIKGHNRLNDKVNRMEAAQIEDHDVLHTEALRRITRLEETLGENLAGALQAGTIGGNKSFIVHLRETGTSDAEIRDALVILADNGDDELDRTNEEMFGEFLTAFISLRRTVNEHTTQIENLDRRVAASETTSNNRWSAVRDWQANGIIETEEKISKMAWVLAVVVGVIVWFLFWQVIPLTTGGEVIGSEGDSVGTFTGNFSMGWLGLAMGLLSGAVILAIGRQSHHTTVPMDEPANGAPAAQQLAPPAPPAAPANPPTQQQSQPTPAQGAGTSS